MSALIEIRDLNVTYRGQWPRRGTPVHALKNVSLSIPRGVALGIIGESGSGKSTLGRVILRLQRPDSGSVQVNGDDPFVLRGHALRHYRRSVQAVFQDSQASLDPRMRIGDTVREGLDIHRIGNRDERLARVEAVLEQVGLDAAYMRRFPHTLSGGQRQRVNIARSLILDPTLLVADEPVSSLDVAIQAQILDLFADLRARLGLTLVFISHDLSVVEALCDEVVILQQGRLVEQGPVGQVLADPRERYTRELLAAVPRLPPAAGRSRAPDTKAAEAVAR